MSVQERKKRERAEREQLIVTTAQQLAEAEGWDAVTTRRLAEAVDYSQPVLYSHFSSKDAIMAAVAARGFAMLAGDLRAARNTATQPPQALASVAKAYAAFAEQRPALYDAMFTHPVDLPFASPEAPDALRAGFDELRQTLGPLAEEDDVDTLVETFWAALHGLLSLTRNGRLRLHEEQHRLALLINRFARY